MSSLLPCTQDSRLMPKPNSSTKPLAFGNSSALTIRKPNSNVIAPYTTSHPNKHSIGTPTHHPTCNDRVPLFLLGIVSSYSPDWQSGHIVHCPGCHPVVLCPLARHSMPVFYVHYAEYYSALLSFPAPRNNAECSFLAGGFCPPLKSFVYSRAI